MPSSVVPSRPAAPLESGASYALRTNPSGLPELSRFAPKQNASGLYAPSSTRTDLELCCGDDSAGVKTTKFLAGRDFDPTHGLFSFFISSELPALTWLRWLRQKRETSIMLNT